VSMDDLQDAVAQGEQDFASLNTQLDIPQLGLIPPTPQVKHTEHFE